MPDRTACGGERDPVVGLHHSFQRGEESPVIEPRVERTRRNDGEGSPRGGPGRGRAALRRAVRDGVDGRLHLRCGREPPEQQQLSQDGETLAAGWGGERISAAQYRRFQAQDADRMDPPGDRIVRGMKDFRRVGSVYVDPQGRKASGRKNGLGGIRADRGHHVVPAAPQNPSEIPPGARPGRLEHVH